MNTLEQRIYRDATAAASEVTDADIPPLRLSPRRRRSPGSRVRAGQHAMLWSGTSRGSTARRVLAPLAAASVVALVAVLVTVGHGSSAPARAGHQPTAPAKHPVAGRRIGTEALDWYFPASGATYTRGQIFGWTQDKITARDIDPCLAAAGFPQPPFHGSRQLFELSFPSGQFPDLAQLRAHPGQHVFTGQYPVVKNPTKARMNRFDHAQARCTARFASDVTRVDKAAGKLQSAWLGIVSRIEYSAPVNATHSGFVRCLESHGVPASLATQTTGGNDPLFAGFYAWADSLTQSAPGTAQLTRDQRHESGVFVACAGPTVAVLEKAQLARRVVFFRQHSGQIARIARLAGEMGGIHPQANGRR